MKCEIKVPAMGESISEATVGEIIKPDGSYVKLDEEILELETDKVNQVLYAPQAGTLSLKVSSEEVVKIGQIIGYVDTEAAPSKEAEETPIKEKKEEKSKEAVPVAPLKGGARVSKGKYLSTLKEAPEQKETPPSFEMPPKQEDGKEESSRQETRRRMTKIRRVIAKKLVEAKQTTAMLTTFNEVDLSAVMELRGKYKDYFVEEYGIKLGLMSFFVKAAVSALAAFPAVNSYIDKEDIVYREYFDIGIAVGTDKGVIVPVVRDCNKLAFSDIERSIAEFAKKAREGTLSVEDLQGGGFTITNGGTYGSLLSTPILNPPQSGILGMHKIEKRPVVIGDEIVIRPMMYLALSYDHRVIDGKESVSFLVHIKNCLEDPSRLLLGV